MENQQPDTVILPKGTVVKFQGLPCELTSDTEVISSTIAAIGLEAARELNGCHSPSENESIPSRQLSYP
jgi:hypothetical protein